MAVEVLHRLVEPALSIRFLPAKTSMAGSLAAALQVLFRRKNRIDTLNRNDR